MKGKKIINIAIAMVLVTGMALGLASQAFAVHDLSLFELDRNVVDNSGAPAPDDWATLYGGGGSAESFTGILPDIGANGGTQFQGGGSKDNNNITQWLWNPGEPLDKDDITNAYAAGYIYQGSEVCPSGVPSGDPKCTEPGDLIIYYGLDRFANNGSAQVGFWFFQSPVGLTNIASQGGFKFSGSHTLGDLLIQSNFSQGGVISSISVYKWVGSGGSNGALNLVYSAQDCATTSAGDLACATVNQSSTNSPWPYTPKSGPAGAFPAGSFFEGGVNVSALVPEAGCFSGFMAETRTADPFDARLKDFALGSLSLCHIEGTKYLDVNGNGTRDQGEPPLANWQIQLSGAASKTTTTDANGHYIFNDLGNGSYTVTEVCPAATPAWVQTEPGAHTGDSCGAETYSFTINLGHTVGIGDFGNGAPAIDVAKTCSAVVEVGKPISYGFDVTNTGNVNLVNVDVTDPIAGFSSLNQSLLAGGTQHYSKQVNAPLSGQSIVNTVSATGDFGSSTVFASVSDTASCTTKVVDAKITIAPDATNAVGAAHTFTVTVYKDDGSGAGFVAAAAQHVDFTLTNSNGAAYVLNAASSTCDDAGANTDASGQCKIVFTSNSAGKVTGHASSSVSVGGLSLFRQTDGTAPNSGDAVKTFVNAYITIAPDATNVVGAAHTFTVTVYKDDGSGAGFVAAAGQHVDFTLTNSNGAAYVLNAASSTCDDAGANTDASGQCKIVFTSNSAGKVTGHASSSVSVGGLSLFRETNGSSPNSGDAVKTFVDARISISPDGTNGIGEDHTFGVLAEKNEGQGAGWVPADDGTKVAVTLTDSNGASSSVSIDTCSTTGTINGLCSVTFSSSSAGTTTGHASATILSGGLGLFRETDGSAGNSGDATKIWIAGSLSWLKQDNNGNPLGGATFEVCRTADRFGNPVSGECVTVLDNSSPDEDSASGQFLLTNLFLGTYTIQETVPPAGYAGDSFVETLVLTLADPSQAATHIWVNTPNQGCTPGFWQGGAGSQLWDQVNDPDWIYNGTNPYIHTTLFNTFFSVTTDSRLAGLSMFDLVSGGGGPDPAIKAARDMVAAYLNESAFPAGFPAASLQDLTNMWYSAVAGGDAALSAFHTLVSGWNSPAAGFCPLP